MTPRQVYGLLPVIQKAQVTDFYNGLLSYATVHQMKLPSLEEFLNLTLGGEQKQSSSFDDKTDKMLEEHAMKALKERQLAYVKRPSDKD